MENLDFQDLDSKNLNFTAKKSLGQNFLHAPQVISAMAHAAELKKDDIILEAGPGKGVLTKELLMKAARVIAVEKDDRAIPFLTDKFKRELESGQLMIVHGDILEFDPVKYGLKSSSYKIVANIPYYISGEFLRKFLESDIQPSHMVVMLQKELAKRVVDEKGSILSISVKAYGNPKYITSVPRKFFRPMPNVDSAVLLVENISKNLFLNNKIEEKTFFEVLKSGFAHKRKVLIKNLEEKIDPGVLKKHWEEVKLSPTVRAEELSMDDWISIGKLR